MKESEEIMRSDLRHKWEIKNMTKCVDTVMATQYVFWLEEELIKAKNQIAAGDSDANIAIQQGSVPDLRAVDKGISPAKRGCAGCIFCNRLESAEPCSSCDQETLSSFTSLQTKHSA